MAGMLFIDLGTIFVTTGGFGLDAAKETDLASFSSSLMSGCWFKIPLKL